MVLHELCLFRGAVLEILLHEDLRYELRYGDLVLYRDGTRTVNGKKGEYRFRSVEQLRYDFERDVAAAGGSLGADS